jgi:copper chaperone CopZ
MLATTKQGRQAEECTMTTVAFEIKGMTCEGCEGSVSRAVGQVPGVADVIASHTAEQIDVRFLAEPDDEAVRAAVEEAGFDFVGRR